MKIREIKRRLNGSHQEFLCDLIYRDDEAMIIRWQSTGKYAAIASMSEGYYWEDRHYLIYRMFREGALYGHRFDVCRDVRFGPDTVEFTDLFLDFFVTPDGELQIHDEDEVAEAIATGVVSPADQQIILET